MKDTNRKLLDGVSRVMFGSNNLDIDTFLHTVELVVEDEVKEREEKRKLGSPVIPDWLRYGIDRVSTDKEKELSKKIRDEYKRITGVEYTEPNLTNTK